MNVQVDPNVTQSPAPQSVNPPVVRQPNLYELSGEGIHITYSTTSFGGVPLFTYQDGSQSKQFTGSQIRTVQTEIGTLVTVTIFLTVDSGSTTFTVLIPAVNLRSTDSVAIRTDAIATVHRFLVIGPPLQGQTELYTVYPLSGTASFVVF
jgi:hypothetical protein